MNAYYHEITINCNWWMLGIVVANIVMILVGVCQYYNVRQEVYSRFDSKLMRIISGVLAGIIAVMVFSESLDGVIQYLDNHALEGGYDVAWSVVVAPVAVLVMACAIWLELFLAGHIAGLARAGAFYLWIERKNRVQRAAESTLAKMRQEKARQGASRQGQRERRSRDQHVQSGQRNSGQQERQGRRNSSQRSQREQRNSGSRQGQRGQDGRHSRG